MFANRNVLVTGGSRGIGRAVVEEFAGGGANVAFTYGSNAVAAESLLLALRQRHPDQTFCAYRCDGRDAETSAAVVADVIEKHDGLDVLVNNAGITRDGLFMAMSAQDWLDVIDVNLNSQFVLTQAVVFQMMKQGHGSIINMTSVSGVHGNSGQVNYSAAKAGIIGFTKALSKEVVRRGIRVNAIAPGFIETDMTAALSEAQRKHFVDRIGMLRMGAATEVAKVAVFLASDAASYVTGQVLAVDGGIVI